MKVTERLAVIDRISKELRSRYTYDELIPYLEAHGLSNLPAAGGSKRLYAALVLRGAPDTTIANMADELEIGLSETQRPDKWKQTDHVRMFISHISQYKKEAQRLQECMWKYAVCGFVAHEDITPTREWETEIMRALGTMEVFVSMHRPGFSASWWCQQEVGWAVARQVLIIPLMMGEEPRGFIAKKQGLIRDHRQDRAEDIAKRINTLIDESDLKMRLLNAQMPF